MTVIQFRRRSAGGAAGAPAALKSGEPAFNMADTVLYVGYGDDGAGNATSIIPIGGPGAFTTLGTTQTITGQKTFSGAHILSGTGTLTGTMDATAGVLTAATQTNGDNSSRVATTAFVAATKLNQLAAPNAAVSLGGFAIQNLADPTSAQDAATRQWTLNQVSSAASGILAIKAPVRALIAANVALTGIPTTGQADGITLVDGDRVLTTGQTTAAQNQIWLVHAGAWTQPTDFNASAEITGGTEVLVNEGTTYGGSVWRLSTTGAITLGSTGLSWLQVNKINTYTAGNGLSLIGFVFSVQSGSTGTITVSAGGIDLTTVGPGTGAYAGGMITVDAYGRVSAATNTMSSGTIGSGVTINATIDGGTF